MDNLEPHIALWLASLWGAISYAALAERNATFRGWLACAFIGTGAGVCMAPALCTWREITHQAAGPFFGFIFGMLGVIICRSAIDSAKSDTGQMLTQSLRNFIRRVTGNEPPKPPRSDPNPGSDPHL